MDLKLIVDAVSFLANALTVATAGIALWVFLFKRKDISTAFSLLLTWSFQSTLTDLRGKLDRLNEYKANEPAHLLEIRNILHEIAGQVRGNKRLSKDTPNLASRLERFAKRPLLDEPAKRSMVAEVREILRNIQVNSMGSNVGNDNE